MHCQKTRGVCGSRVAKRWMLIEWCSQLEVFQCRKPEATGAGWPSQQSWDTQSARRIQHSHPCSPPRLLTPSCPVFLYPSRSARRAGVRHLKRPAASCSRIVVTVGRQYLMSLMFGPERSRSTRTPFHFLSSGLSWTRPGGKMCYSRAPDRYKLNCLSGYHDVWRSN